MRRAQAQVSEALGKLLPSRLRENQFAARPLSRACSSVPPASCALTLGLIYPADVGKRHADNMPGLERALEGVLWRSRFIIGVVAWLFVLAQQSRRAAEEETRRQTALLIQEIDAHKRTDAELQRAKEVADRQSGQEPLCRRLES